MSLGGGSRILIGLALLLSEPLLGVISGLFGAILLLIGVGMLVKTGPSKTSGEVTVTVRRSDDLDDVSWNFPDGETAVAEAIVRQATLLNGPTKSVTHRSSSVTKAE